MFRPNRIFFKHTDDRHIEHYAELAPMSPGSDKLRFYSSNKNQTQASNITIFNLDLPIRVTKTPTTDYPVLSQGEKTIKIASREFCGRAYVRAACQKLGADVEACLPKPKAGPGAAGTAQPSAA